MKPGPCSTAPASQAEAEILNYLAQEIEHYFSIFKDVFASTDVHGLKTLSVVGLAVGKARKLPTINRSIIFLKQQNALIQRIVS